MTFARADRWRLSAISSLVAGVVALWLFLAFPTEVSPIVSAVAAVVFFWDAYVKWNDLPERRYSTILYSFAFAALILGGFLFAGDPWSYVFAVLWIVDAILKVPGIDTKWEGRFRHGFSALMTTLLGLVLLFGVRVFGSFVLSFLLGWAVLYDAYYKWVYLRDRDFYVP